MLYTTHYESPLGDILLASDGKCLSGVWLHGQKYHGEDLGEPMEENDSLPIFLDTKKWLDRYFAGEQPEISELPLTPKGTEFRKKVWAVLCQIPYGKTMTYGEIGAKVAKQMGKDTMSSQAVGGAVGHNPISVIIPCHRVIGANGSLTGYAGGIDAKIHLLTHEAVDLSDTYVPVKGTAL